MGLNNGWEIVVMGFRVIVVRWLRTRGSFVFLRMKRTTRSESFGTRSYVGLIGQKYDRMARYRSFRFFFKFFSVRRFLYPLFHNIIFPWFIYYLH
jgi:hypothetical protein